MVTPRWVSTKAQPIGIRDLLDYLVQPIDVHIEHDEILEIGGSDRMYCLVIAGLSCLFMPFGTVLVVFTLITLMKEPVKELFEQQSC